MQLDERNSKAATRNLISDPVSFLEQEYARRVAKNARYSLRAFAKHLKISNSLLSLIFARKRRVSSAVLKKIEFQFAISPDQLAVFQCTVGKDFTPNRSASFTNGFQSIHIDQFSLLADWEHYAILSLLETAGASLNLDWIALRLGITSERAKAAIARLKRLDLIAKVDGKWKQSSRPLILENKVATLATRKHQRQVLIKAGRSMKKDSFESRDISSTTFAMNPKDVPYARMRIRQFRRQLVKELEARGNAEEVYNLAVQIYPISSSSKSK